jgi:hypothetical protein
MIASVVKFTPPPNVLVVRKKKMAKINLLKAKHLVDELGLVEEYARELKAEIDMRKKALYDYVGQTLTTEEFTSSIFERTSNTLDLIKLKKKFGITDKQWASCYKKGDVSTIVTIKRIDISKSEQRKDFLKSAKAKVGQGRPRKL